MLSGIPLCQNISSILVLEHEVNYNTVINEEYNLFVCNRGDTIQQT